MKKYLKTIILVSIMAVLVVGYFLYLSGKEPETDKFTADNNNRELEALLTKNIDSAYPESPKEVVKLYARITEAYYKTKLDENQVNTLASQARKLFDDEFLKLHPEEKFLSDLKSEISQYNDNNMYVSDYKVDESENVEYKTFKGEKYAMLNVSYMIRQGVNLEISKTKYTLRQDGEGRWKILYWELENQ